MPLDPTGLRGPTRGQARSPALRRTSRGRYVPAATPRTGEQRAVEVAACLPEGGMLSGWAALRLQHAGWFDGLAPDGRTELPVPVLLPHESRRTIPGAVVLRARNPPRPTAAYGVPVADPGTAVLHQVRLTREPREKVVVVDMAAAAGLIALDRLRERLQGTRGRDADMVRWVLDHASEDSGSPRETRMVLVWRLDAGYPDPLRNPVVVTRDGQFVGKPDLLCVECGVAGEYDGAVHRTRERHRRDEARLERFRAVGIERFTIVAGDSVATQVARMRAAVARATRFQDEPRQWLVRGSESTDPWL